MANYGKYGFLPSIALCLLWATEVSWAQVKLVRMPVVEYNTLMENQLNTETKQTPAQMQGESGDGGQRGTLGSHRRARPSCDVNGVTRMTSAASHVRHLEPHACKTGNENREK